MKKYLFLVISIFQTGLLFSQTHFIISGKTNLITNGMVVLSRNAPDEFYSDKIKNDTTSIRNQFFSFSGIIDYPEQFRLAIFDDDNNFLTEPFFVDSGIQKILIDSNSNVNDISDFGYGIVLEGSKVNDKYFKKYLPLYNNLNRQIDSATLERDKCDSIKDSKTYKRCMISWENDRVNIRKTRDSILLNYATQYPQSPIIPWILYSQIWYYGYTNYYQSTFKKIAAYTLPDIDKSLKAFLDKQKMKAVGSTFPLIDLVKAHTPGIIQKNKYTLIDFWYSHCIPCIGQFSVLKNVYQKNNTKGFDMVAISVDTKKNLPHYEKLLKQNNYPWKQILDTSGIKTRSIGITGFPSNFLLDNKGKIISVNIDPYVLSDFLDKNL